ncbi:MAG: hypothetical protein NVS1B10_08790 [Candidatus Saccharimonadales bacterium]
MENACDYFLRTENTVRMLLEEDQICKAKIKAIQDSIILGDAEADLTTSKITFGEWLAKNKDDKSVFQEAQRKYSIEAFSGGLIAGSVLQIAARAIEHYSKNTAVPNDWEEIFRKKSLPTEFFIGKTVHTVPLGLIIYAGWNQYINHTGRGVRAITQEVFARLAIHSGQFEFQALIDQSTNFDNPLAEYFASTVLDALGWNEYDRYIADMKHALL